MMGGYGYGYGPTMMDGGFGWFGIIMFLFWMLVFVGVVLLVVWLVRRSGGHGAGSMMHTQSRDEACDIARARYAKGEITKEQYEEMCKTLGV